MSFDTYQDPIVYRMRKGSVDDPYIEISQTDKVRNGIILLREIPDKFNGITVTDGTINLATKDSGIPDANTVVVDWTNGILTFDSFYEGQTFTINFMGRGNVYLPSSKVYTNVDENGNVIETLQTLTDSTEQARDSANTAADNANTQATYAQQQGDYAKTQGDYAKQVGDENKTVWKTPVANFDEIATTYPSPQHGWTVQTIDNGKIYRYNSVTSTWEYIQEYNNTAITDLQNQLSKQNQQSTTIGHGLNVINASQNSPLDIQIEGRTLVNVSQNVLDSAKYYVLADKKSKVKFADATTYTGVAKFQGKDEKPILIRIEDFEGKVAGSTVENPYVAKRVGIKSTLQTPTGTWSEFLQSDYDKITKQDGTTALQKTTPTTSGLIAQHLFSFNIIEAVERTLGKIPSNTTADKVTWLKNNINTLTIRWHGYGTSPTGNNASLAVWNDTTTSWVDTVNHTNGSVTQLSFAISGASITDRIDSNGFIHFLAYADPSDETVESTIYTDYIELETELLQNAQLYFPRFPLYEVTSDEYNNILVSWDENEVMRRYPMVESVQHVQAPYVIAEGENLLPPFTEWTLHANAVVREPYELELNATAGSQISSVDIPCKPDTQYTISVVTNSDRFGIFPVDASGVEGSSLGNAIGTPLTFTTPSTAVKIRVKAYSTTAGTFTFTNPMLNLDSTAKPFVPRNPSTLYAEVKLGALSDKKDILWKDGQDWKVTKWIEKDVVLDGGQNWSYYTDKTGFKIVKIDGITSNLSSYLNVILSKYDGIVHKNVSAIKGINEQTSNTSTLYASISDTDSGWGEDYTPSSSEVKAYFWGWRMCDGNHGVPYNGTGTKTWYPIGDTDLARATTTTPTSAAPTITEGKIGYYKLSYVLATAKTIVVTDKVEGDLVVNGATQVEVGSGVIVREKVIPQTSGSSNYYHLNNLGVDTVPDVPLKNKVRTILKIFRNNIEDKQWIIQNSTTANGLQRAYINKKDYDPTAEYTVTYLVLDRHLFTNNILSVIANYDSSLKSVVDSVVAKQADIATQVSVNVRAIAELYKRVKALGG